MFSAHTQKWKYLVWFFCFIRECILVLKILRHCLWFLSPLLFHFLTLLGVSHFKLNVFKCCSHNFYHFLSLSCIIRNFFQFTILFFRCFNPYTEVSFLNFSDCVFYLVLFQTSVFHTVFFTASWSVSSPTNNILFWSLVLSLPLLEYFKCPCFKVLHLIRLSLLLELQTLQCVEFAAILSWWFVSPGLYNFFISSSSSQGCVPQVCRPPCRVVLYLQLPGSSRCHWD